MGEVTTGHADIPVRSLTGDLGDSEASTGSKLGEYCAGKGRKMQEIKMTRVAQIQRHETFNNHAHVLRWSRPSGKGLGNSIQLATDRRPM